MPSSQLGPEPHLPKLVCPNRRPQFPNPGRAVDCSYREAIALREREKPRFAPFRPGLLLLSLATWPLTAQAARSSAQHRPAMSLQDFFSPFNAEKPNTAFDTFMRA